MKRGDYLINTDIEYRRGVLFIRVKRSVYNDGDKIDLIKDLVKKIGIKYLVLNFDDNSLDNDFKLHLIINNYKYLMEVSCKVFLCGNVDITMCNNLCIDKINYEMEAYQRM